MPTRTAIIKKEKKERKEKKCWQGGKEIETLTHY